MAEQLAQSWPEQRMAQEVERLLAANPAYHNLDEGTRHTLSQSLVAVTRALALAPPSAPVGSSLAGVEDLRQRMSGGSGSSPDGAATSAPPGQGAQPPAASTAPASSPTTTTGR